VRMSALSAARGAVEARIATLPPPDHSDQGLRQGLDLLLALVVETLVTTVISMSYDNQFFQSLHPFSVSDTRILAFFS